MREEDNIEKEGLQEDNPDIGDNSGDEDFAEYDDLSALEGLPQIDELDNMDDLSGVSDVASTIDFDESGHQDESEDDIDIPLPDIDFSEDDGIASELSDGSDIKTTYPEIKDDDNNAADDSTVEEPQVSEDIATEKDAEIETQSDAEAEQSGADIMSLSEDGADEEQSDADIMSLSEDGADEEQSDADIMSLSEDGADEEQPDNDIMSLTEDGADEEQSDADIMSLSEDGADEEQPDNDIMSLTEDGTADDESGSIDDMLGGLLDDFDKNGSIGDESEEQSKENSGSDAGDGQKADDLSDLLGMLSDDSTSDDVISLDSVSNEEIPDISEIPDIPMQEEEDISNILPQNEEKEDDGEKQSIFKKVFGNVVTDEIAEAEKKQEEEEAAKKEEAEKVKEEKAAEKAAAKAKKAEEKAAKKAEKQAQKEAEREAAANEVVGKLNKVGVSIVAVFGVIILAGIIIGTNSFGSGLDKKKATNYFEMHRYSQAYESAVGTNMKEKNPEQYKKIVTVMKVQHALDSYQNYENVKKYPEALDALLMGLKKYDANKKTAYDLEIENDLASVYDKILDILSDEFGLSKSQAYDILSLGSSEYTSKVNAIAAK